MAHTQNPISTQKIRKLRKMMNLTQASAASLADVNLSTWKRWESGKHQMPARIFDRFVEIKVVEDIQRAAGGDVSLFIVEAVLDMLPPVTAPVWSNEAAWRGLYSDAFDLAEEEIAAENVAWPSHPSSVIWSAMREEADAHTKYDDPIWSDESAWRSHYSQYDSEISAVERDHAEQRGGSLLHPRDIVFLAVGREQNKIPKVSDPIWSDEAAWRAIGRYAELLDSKDVIGMETIWPPRPRDVVALGMCRTESDEIVGQAWRQAGHWVASDPEHRVMPDEICWFGSLYYPDEAEAA